MTAMYGYGKIGESSRCLFHCKDSNWKSRNDGPVHCCKHKQPDFLILEFWRRVSSTKQNPLHIYSAAIIYTVNLTASNRNGTASKLATMTVSEKSEPVLPVAKFSANTTEGYTHLAVQFTDLSENADSVAWDFNGDEVTDSEEINPVYEFETLGNYTANLTAINGNDKASKTASIIVLEISIHSGSISSSIGGNSYRNSGSDVADVSPQPSKNVEVRDPSQLFTAIQTEIQPETKFRFLDKVMKINEQMLKRHLIRKEAQEFLALKQFAV